MLTGANNVEAIPIAIGSSAGNSTAIKYSEWRAGFLYLPATTSMSAITWYVSPDGVTYCPALDGTGSAGTGVPVVSEVPATACAVPVPTALLGAAWIKPVGNVAIAGASYTLKG